ncbi:acyl-CoA dehydrogenase family protein [Gammaproteobacteria bacterium]|nr:acyl-CoA dehydrogenase family protein [Gammaproteobacteria bacterium]MDC0226127.1 acyl-CoA dehydrogenase family protein [Gammaproteobacteria bacterium]
MLYKLPEETLMLQETVRRFVENELIPLESKFPERPNSYELPDEEFLKLTAKVHEMGLTARETPEEAGGAGLGTLDNCVVTEQVHRSTAGCSVFSATFASMLYELGTEEQKEKYMVPSVKGEFHGASAFSEPGAGGDLAGIQTTIEKTDDGWVINGNKCWIFKAKTARFILVLTRLKGTERHDGLQWVIIDAGTPGFKIGREQKMIHGQNTYELFFDNCVVDEKQLLGKTGQAWSSGTDYLFSGRIQIAARALGIADRCLEMAKEYSKIRHTFGKPLSSRQAIQWMIADSALELHNCRLLVYDTALRAQEGEKVYTETAMAKLSATEMVARVVDRAMQIHGAAGLSDETILERCYRDIRPMRIYEGTSEALRSMIAKDLLK